VRQDHSIGWIQLWLSYGPPENAQLVAKEKEFNLTVRIAFQPEHE
jgi:hypothetical protein